MTGRVVVGVDLGTQGVRALAVDDDGEVRAAASRPLHSRRDRGADGGARHEQRPEEWCRAAEEVLGEIAGAVDVGRVHGLAVDATSGSVVLVDEREAALTPGVMYDDARGAAHLDRVREAGAAVWERLGYVVGPTWALPTLLPLLADHPGGRVRHQGDVVNAHLVGHPVATDTSSALKTGYDLVARRWPTEVLGALGIDPAQLPDVVRPGTVVGGVDAAVAERTGLRAGTPVVAGMTDGCAAQLAAGAVTPGSWNTVLGTTLVLKGVTEQLLRDPTGSVYCHLGPQGGWWPGGASSTGAAVLAELVAPGRFEEHTAALLAHEPPVVPVVYPLSGRGERFPFAAPDAAGFWLDDRHARGLDELVGAVGERQAFAGIAEGVAFVERLAFEHLAGLGADVTGPRTITGGATANRWWNQRRADVLGVPLHRPRHAEPAFGMAVLARAAADDEPDLVATAEVMVHRGEVLEPRHAPAADERYETFRAALVARGWLPEGCGP
ncbi:FGGY family carbohydrate kinase [Actinomycetospora sp. TBRC 11914]|uniref:FGGY-family carbohydrate kinase n=1 Tax=Actinomycetospora sp. TBRC 11914 TaxID=2729387 RepID=UPI00145DBAA7|nr:FGGY family carbohydrate kinase [Actinomycetospora sp. TBRC 11914]NMO93558.1 carbohydrate kinase [Actinomycetospora sp. TBRC 11914]